jgi:hypothetical protein
LRKFIALQHNNFSHYKIKFLNFETPIEAPQGIQGKAKANRGFISRGLSATAHLKKLIFPLETSTFSSSMRSAG